MVGAGLPAASAKCIQGTSSADVLVQGAVIEPGGDWIGRISSLCWMAWYAPPAGESSLVVNSSLVEQLGRGDGRDTQPTAQLEALLVDRVYHPGDRAPAALSVEAEPPGGGLDPARVAHHPRWVQDRIRQVGFEALDARPN